jgi:hypothetical protein
MLKGCYEELSLDNVMCDFDDGEEPGHIPDNLNVFVYNRKTQLTDGMVGMYKGDEVSQGVTGGVADSSNAIKD